MLFGLSILLVAAVGGTALAHAVTNNGFTLFNEATPDPATVGRQMELLITETNNSGDSHSFATTGISASLPAGLTFVSAKVDKSGGTCSFDAANRVVDCKGFDLPNGQTAAIAVIVTPNVAGSFKSTADDFGLAGTVDEPFTVMNGGGGGHHKHHHHHH